MAMRTAGELMPRRLIAVGPEEPLASCARYFHDNDIRHLPVVGEGGELMGMLTEEVTWRWGVLVGAPPVWMPLSEDEPTALSAALPVDVTFDPKEQVCEVVERLVATPQDFSVGVRHGVVVGILTEHDLVWLAQWAIPEDTCVKDIQSTEVLSVGRADAAVIAGDQMRAAGVRHMVVMDEGKLFGVLSLRDVVAAGAADRLAATAEELVCPEPYRVDVAACCPEAADLMTEHKIGCLPVVNEADEVVGVVTRADLAKAMLGFLRHGACADPA